MAALAYCEYDCGGIECVTGDCLAALDTVTVGLMLPEPMSVDPWSAIRPSEATKTAAAAGTLV
jgi:hypothetical protein